MKVVLVIAGLIGLGLALLFFWFDYSSPVHEAGREYKRNVRYFQHVEIESMDDVFERLDVIDRHYNSSTFDKVQGGDKTDVTYSDMETLFGEPHKVVPDVDMSYTETVYQYFFDEVTLNFHERFRTIDEYVVENYTETFYDLSTLDQLFVDAMVNHQTHTNKLNDQFELVPAENVHPVILEQTPTREIYQEGWRIRSFNQQHYYDDGRGEYAPNEYLSLQFKEEEGSKALYYMARRYHDSYKAIDSQSAFEQKQEAVHVFEEFFRENETEELKEKLTVKDLSNELGNMARITYDFQKGTLYLSWVINNGEDMREIMATVPVTDAPILSDIRDLTELEVYELSSQIIYDLDRTLDRPEFIGS